MHAVYCNGAQGCTGVHRGAVANVGWHGRLPSPPSCLHLPLTPAAPVPCTQGFMGVCAVPPALITEYCARGSLADVLKAAR